jgi:uncharacterized protein YlxW (UPF0749 family)
MKNWFLGLSTLWKTVTIVAVLFILLFLATWASGKLGDVRGYLFDRKIEKIEQENVELQKEYDKLKAEYETLKVERVGLDAELKIYEADQKRISAEGKKEQQKLDEKLAELDKEYAEAEKPKTAYQRCLDINKISKYQLNCEEYRSER